MPARFDTELKKLKQKLLQMGAIAEQMIQSINAVLIDNNQDLLPKIYEDEKALDHMQGEIDELQIALASNEARAAAEAEARARGMPKQLHWVNEDYQLKKDCEIAKVQFKRKFANYWCNVSKTL